MGLGSVGLVPRPNGRSKWQRRYLALAMLVLVGVVTYVVATASADAGNPILGTISGQLVVNPPGINGSPAGCTVNGPTFCTVTAYVRGQWNWYSHGSDCNTDRAAAGVGLIWNDPNEPGYTVTNGTLSKGVGVAQKLNGDTLNSLDRLVHPADLGNAAEGYPDLTGQQFRDPGPLTDFSGITNINGSTGANNWLGGCGREPLTVADRFPGPRPHRGRDDQCPRRERSEPRDLRRRNHHVQRRAVGLVGLRREQRRGRPVGYSHTYEKISDVSTICVNVYDVHGGGNVGNKNFQSPNQATDLGVNGSTGGMNGGNNDNSIQTNGTGAFDPTKACVSFPTIATSATGPVALGNPIHDVATLTGAATDASSNFPAASTVTFNVYNATTDPTCTTPLNATPLTSTGPVVVSSKPTYTSANFTPGSPGTYLWIATFAGNSDNSNAIGNCGDSGESSVINQLTPTVSTTVHNGADTGVTVVAAGTPVHDFVSVTGTGPTPTGNVTISWFTNGTCTAPAAATSSAIALTGGTVNATGFPQTPATAGKYGFEASYAGDTNYTAKTGSCEPLTVVASQISLSLAHNPDIVGSGAETVTATVQVDNGGGAGLVAAPIGTVVTLTIGTSSAAGSTFTPGAPLTTTTCATIANGTCTVMITSTGTGTTVVNATSSPLAGPAGSHDRGRHQYRHGDQELGELQHQPLAAAQPRHRRQRPGDGDGDGSGRQRRRPRLRPGAQRNRCHAHDRCREQGRRLYVRRRRHHDHVHHFIRHAREVRGPDHLDGHRHDHRRRERVTAGRPRPRRVADPGPDQHGDRDQELGQLKHLAVARAQPGHPRERR